jgi:hypothetical protein
MWVKPFLVAVHHDVGAQILLVGRHPFLPLQSGLMEALPVRQYATAADLSNPGGPSTGSRSFRKIETLRRQHPLHHHPTARAGTWLKVCRNPCPRMTAPVLTGGAGPYYIQAGVWPDVTTRRTSSCSTLSAGSSGLSDCCAQPRTKRGVRASTSGISVGRVNAGRG